MNEDLLSLLGNFRNHRFLRTMRIHNKRIPKLYKFPYINLQKFSSNKKRMK